MTLGELADRLDDVELFLVDVRTDAEYTGAAGYTCDPRQGHLPGARHIELARLLQASPEEIRALVGAPEGAEVVAYCHSGSRSSLATVALQRAGYEARNYAGSWHEWSRKEELPAVV